MGGSIRVKYVPNLYLNTTTFKENSAKIAGSILVNETLAVIETSIFE